MLLIYTFTEIQSREKNFLAWKYPLGVKLWVAGQKKREDFLDPKGVQELEFASSEL